MRVPTISGFIPSIGIASPTQTIDKLTMLAVPITLVVGLASLHGAQALTLAECYDNCNQHRDAHDLAKIICYGLCHLLAKD